MPESPLVSAGAQVQPISAAALHTNEFFTGMWTQGNPLGAGAVPYLYQKFYSAIRFERLIGGENTEITTRLTLARRPGNSVYNAGPFPPINRFYEFRAFSGSTEQIHVLSSVDGDNTPDNLAIASVEVIRLAPGPYGAGNVIVTFTTAVPGILTGQTYKFSGLTAYPALNGYAPNPMTIPPPGLTALQQAFYVEGFDNYADTPDTGNALVSPAANPATVRDVTGPANNQVLWNKDPNAGRTNFQSVGNICYFADGMNQEKWVLSAKSWAALTLFNQGDFIVDSNGNLQVAVGAQAATVTNISVVASGLPGPPSRLVTLFFAPLTPLTIPNGISLNLSGLTTVPSLNGATPPDIQVNNSLQVSFIDVVVAGNPPLTAFSAETGTASTGNGITGTVAPAWGTDIGQATVDGGAIWICRGPAVELWGIQTPTVAPIVTQSPAPSIYPAWQANTWYAPSAYVIIDSNGNVQKLTTGGITGGAAPAWSVVVGVVTADNTAAWTCLGPPNWAATTVYAVGAVVVVTFTYYITTAQTFPYPPYAILTQTPITVTVAFECTTAGTSGVGTPNWTNGNATTVTDNTVVWTNIGAAPAWPGAAQNVSTANIIEDANGNLQTPQTLGESGAAAPTWEEDAGKSTADGTQLWLNAGPYTPANTDAWIWAYSGKNSITGHIGTASPLSLPLTVAQSNQAIIQAPGLPNDSQIDTIVLWRTLEGGSTLLFEDEFPNPAVGSDPGSWIYTDTKPDDALNEFITAPISDSNDPPPAGFTPQCYYLGRIWGFVRNVLKYSGGPDTITGSGNEAFPPKNQFTFPSLGVTCWPTSIGMIVYTNSDVWAVLGQGTASSPFYVINFQQGVGLANQDAFTVNGSTAYGMLTSGQVVSMDPGAGELEVGFPIGDLFNQQYTTDATYMAWHQGSSADMALYVADGAEGWYRMAAVAAPESGNVWSPRALITGGVKAIASVEILPGQKRLLLGPAAEGPILMRDSSVSTDNDVPYVATAIIGSVVMAQPGTTVGLQFVTTEEIALAGSSPVSIGLLYDEISGTFSNLVNVSNDPPNLPASKTVTTRRFWAMQDAQPVKCRHVQTTVSWKAEPFPNELLTHTIYGRLPEKARK
ncbi:MAG TPA: hypothetical protein VFE27_24335 [Acidobacteriaceae bacterium]|jgi:hypothetical protein|nr:hypothetical protein [Acidobacteriaceae bacterium]